MKSYTSSNLALEGIFNFQAISEIADNLRLYAIDCGVFLHFSKAFDTENHTVLFKKKWNGTGYGVSHPIFCKLSYKYTAICTDGEYSFIRANNDVRNSTREFPRSSIISNLYKRFTELFQCLTLRIFADDTN